ncbi:MAG TPA: TRAP transporter large permease subunit [Noviherbaspirillum sp.]|uniref:TRAP transporter large permease subunit n=1 Tax=Noviherbaspirillum sp. TaxID=1926288 RepID=UPI002B4A06E1|nr:TRAP transporter large permease subunit [Noviherbaspirillum sp.]HJV84178.1 TRAP transporter large permease subunit [Noviherbaspirillum sp.]
MKMDASVMEPSAQSAARPLVPEKKNEFILWRAIDWVTDVAGIISGWAVFFVGLFVLYEVFMRSAFKAPTIWVTDVSTYILAWFCFMTAAYGLKSGSHIEVDVCTHSLAPRAKTILHLAGNAMVLLYVTIFAWFGWQMVWESWERKQATPNLLHFPVWIVQLGLGIGTTILVLQAIRVAAKTIDRVRSMPSERGQFLPLIVLLASLAVSLYVLNEVSEIWGVILLLVVLLFGGVPVFAALGLVGAAGFFFVFGGFDSLSQVAFMGYKSSGDFTLVALPLFVLSGYLLASGGIGEEVFEVVSKFIGHLPGGLVITSIVACAIFAAISGSSVATVATIGSIALPAMLKNGYDMKLALGSLAAGGTLGILIPPSGPMIIYSSITDESVGALFMGGVVPGLLLTVILAAYCAYAHIKSGTGGAKMPKASWDERRKALRKGVWGLFAPVLVLGGIYSGIFTATESAAAVLVYALFVNVVTGRFSWRSMNRAMVDGTKSSSMIMAIIIGAASMGAIFTQLQMPQLATAFVVDNQLPPWLVIASLMVILGVLGMMLEVVSVLLITTPILYPLVTGMGFSGLWFGIFLTVNMELALITPPVGMNLFVLRQMSGTQMRTVITSAVPFIVLITLFAILVAVYPPLSTWLPGNMGYK